MNILKRYNFKYVSNFRDLGGYEAVNKAICWHKLYRSSSLFDLTDDEWLYLKDTLNIRTVIDLRYDYEAKQRLYKTPDKITYINLPLQTPGFDMESLSEKTRKAVSDGKMYEYPQMVLGDTKKLCEIITTITESLEKGGVIFHCYAGKDRTGVVAAVILYLLGVDKSDIIADYEVSYTYNEKTVNPEIRKVVGKEDVPSLHSSACQMKALLDLFDEVDLPTLLYKNGFTSVENLKNSMLI
ncbi:MAG: hypothetical protein DBX47_06255 [Clostridiales bacterium]|nr:MAG: hypothetical protein DBX47_06255 [Clostridiales bacterium]